MADNKKKQMAEEQLDKVAGGVVQQYVLNEAEYNKVKHLLTPPKKPLPSVPTKNPPPDNDVPSIGTPEYVEYMKKHI